jgi:predicted nucleic acid-binding protein
LRVLLDTGVLLRAFDRASLDRPAIHAALRTLWANREEIFTTSQNIAEFWNVSTRPATVRGGYGHPLAAVEARVRQLERIAYILPFTSRAYEVWRQLVVAHQVQGVAVHDARIVSVMIAENISHIVTLNAADFRRYQQITALLPQEVGVAGS